ncbi:MAG: hypothetical protein WCQ16_08255 [Verrucomicrobiae bacterium]
MWPATNPARSSWTLAFAIELAGRDAKTLSSVIARLGVADVRAFGLVWDDCEEILRKLGFSPASKWWLRNLLRYARC